MKFWRPGASAPEETILLDSGSGDKTATFNPNNNLSLSLQRQKLPIFQFRNHILWLVENYKTVVLVGETGCGKSTQIPQYLHEADWTSKGMVDFITSVATSKLNLGSLGCVYPWICSEYRGMKYFACESFFDI